MRVEVLLNSPGVHDEVRIRRPYGELQRIGIDCRIHERPFRMRQCVREGSVVIWQRPLPESRELMIQNFIWFSERGCLLLMDLDDHPELFDKATEEKMINQGYANLKFCHGILTSNGHLAGELRKYNPSVYTVDNCIGNISQYREITKQNKNKTNSGTVKIFIANQNREKEHQKLKQILRELCIKNSNVHFEIIADRTLAESLPSHARTSHPRLNYRQYRKILSECHIALAPLNKSVKNECKTVIKWQECAAEGVVLVAGPELYGRTLDKDVGIWIENINDLLPITESLINDPNLRTTITEKARSHLIRNGWVGKQQTLWHEWLLASLWRKRSELDWYSKQRITREMSKKELCKHGAYFKQ
jgi:hypothetical protein